MNFIKQPKSLYLFLDNICSYSMYTLYSTLSISTYNPLSVCASVCEWFGQMMDDGIIGVFFSNLSLDLLSLLKTGSF